MCKHTRLTRRGRMYWFRAKVPVDLLDHYAPKKEITFSLKTSAPKEALEKVRIESVKVDQEFRNARRQRDAEPQSSLTDAEIERLSTIYLHQLLEEDEEVRIFGRSDEAVFENVREEIAANNALAGQVVTVGSTEDRDFRKSEEALEHVQPALKHALARGDASLVEFEVDDLLDWNGIKLDKASPEYRKLAFAILRTTVKANEMINQRQQGESVETPAAPAPLRVVAPEPEGDDIPLSHLWERYKGERKPPVKTVSDFGTYVRRFIEVHGDLPVKTITRKHVRDFKDAMLKLPKRMNAKMRALTVPRLLEQLDGREDIPRLSVRTVNDKALGAIGAVFGYGFENGYLDINPAHKIKATGPKNFEPARIPYSIDDLKTIFGSPVFKDGFRPIGGGGEAAKWLPLLALFTGARLEELGQLRVDDVGEEQGVPYFFLHTMNEGRRLKAQSSRRKVPVHPELVRLGLLEYVEQRRKAGDERLLPDLKSKRTEITAAFSTWWRRYTTSIGIDDKRKVFHSFRHLVKRMLRNEAGVDKTLRDALMGHATEDDAEDYGRDEEGFGFALPVLHNALSRLEYPGLDLSHLRMTN